MIKTVPVQEFDCVVFGGSGDLAMRKLLPALAARFSAGQIPPDSRIYAAARSVGDTASFRAQLIDKGLAADFVRRVDYVQLDANSERGWDELAAQLNRFPERVRVFYLSVGPDLFVPIAERLAQHGLVSAPSRIVLEKPIGHDRASAQAINDAIARVFEESQIFRIDHYLGKETVQNLFVLRFGNALFEPVWNRDHIDHVQVTVAETVGLEGRIAYYNQAGAFRDMVQNHLLQLVCLIAMEPPAEYEADRIRDEKLKVLRALAPVQEIVRGQYGAGAMDAKAVAGYAEELGTASDTETFVAVRLEVDNWRWAGVPFYLRTGKRLPEKVSEIVVQFKPVPHRSLPDDAGELRANRLIIRLQPDEGVQLGINVKEPGPGGLRTQPVDLDVSFEKSLGTKMPEAYERLLMDVVRGNQTLFMRRDEVDAAWAWAMPVLALIADAASKALPYASGTWGPAAAHTMMARDGREWAS